MILYFSGIKDERDATLLRSAGIEHVLCDDHDLPNAAGFEHVALDSGAYRAFKDGRVLTVADYARQLDQLQRQRSTWFDFVVAPDVIGDADLSRRNWQTLRDQHGWHTTPVWQWGSPLHDLDACLNDALLVQGVPLVGVGGLVPHLRSRRDDQLTKVERAAWQTKRLATLEQLRAVAEQYPGVLHAFGLCWTKAIEDLGALLYSADTSLYLDAARYGDVIFQHTRTGHLSHAPARRVPTYAALAGDRAARVTESARNLANFCRVAPVGVRRYASRAAPP